MKVVVKRTFKGADYTIGKLYLDGHYLCDTLEDTVRPAGVKIAGKTAIPTGTYKCKKTWSPRFATVLPELFNVPGFTGIRIHKGNTAKDTEGCILVGLNKTKGAVIDSQATFNFLMARLPTEFEITIE